MVNPSIPPGIRAKAAIPDGLRHQLEGFRRHLWRAKIIEAVAAGAIGLLASFLLVYGIDRLWQTPFILRLLILVTGGALAVIFAPYWLHRWIWKQRKEDQLARLIARRYPGLGDRLLGVIELQRENVNRDGHSSRLLEAAVEAVAIEAAHCDLEAALPLQKHRTWVWCMAVMVAVVSAVVAVAPRASINAMHRLLMPWSMTERYTFTRLDRPPSSRVVAIGEPFEITLKLGNESERRPSNALGQIGSQPAVMSPLQKNSYHFTFPGQQESVALGFKVGDLRHEVRVIPMSRPAVESALATVTYPNYLGLAPKTLDLTSGELRVVDGSQVLVSLTTNRQLASGKFGPTQPKPIAGSVQTTSPEMSSEGVLEISGKIAKSARIAVGAVPFEIPFSWIDSHGLMGEAGYRLRVTASQDNPPSCYLQGLDRQKVMLPEETLDFEISAEDDFALNGFGIEWEGQADRLLSGLHAKGSLRLGSNEGQRVTKPVAFSPAALGIAPQKITIRGYCQDAYPKRTRIYSEPITLYVLTRDEHAQMLKGKFDRIVTELEDVVRREQELLDENQRLLRLGGQSLQGDVNRKRLEGQEHAEAESENRMRDLTGRMEDLMKDSTRNGEIPKATLQKVVESLKPMQELYQKDLPAVKGGIRASQLRSNTAETTSADLSGAVDAQAKAVEKMQQTIAKAGEANQRFEAGTFINRLKKAADEQSALVNSLVDGFKRLLGERMLTLDPSDQRRLKQASTQQATTASDLRWLQEDLSNYFGRTKAARFKQLLDEMRSSRIDVGLEEIVRLLGVNHVFVASGDSKKWADQLTAWAEELEGSSGGSESGGGAGHKSLEDEDFEFMLRVMKLVQQEQDLRGQTRVLEQARRMQLDLPKPADAP